MSSARTDSGASARLVDELFGCCMGIEFAVYDRFDEPVEAAVSLGRGEQFREEGGLSDGEELAAGALATHLLEAARGLEVTAMVVDRLEKPRDAFGFVGDGLNDRDFPTFVAGEIHEDMELLVNRVGGGQVCLVDH